MITYTTGQKTALAIENQNVLTAVKIEAASTIAYCDGLEAVSLGGQVYTPHDIRVGNIRLADPERSTATVSILDLDNTVTDQWLSSRISGSLVTITEAVWSEGAWVAVRTLPWFCDKVKKSPQGVITLALKGSAGIRTRAGLETANRARWRYAPRPGEAAQVGQVIIRA